MAAVAAFIVAFIIGGTLAVFTIALAWIFFRPLLGILLLAVSGVGIYLTFFHKYGGKVDDESADEPSGDSTEPETVTVAE